MMFNIVTICSLLFLSSLMVVEAFIGNNGNMNRNVPTRTSLLLEAATTTNEEGVVKINPRNEGLALMLDDGTRKSHSFAQNTDFVSGFFKGLGSRESFSALVTSLYFVYTAMEEAMDVTTNENVQIMDDRALRRVESLEQDLKYLLGDNLKSQIQPSPATKAYVKRIHEISQATGTDENDKSYLLLAHMYTRYLGDLFGGQMMGGMATRSLQLEKGNGVAFYTFNDISSVNNYITDWYERLNQLDLTQKQKEEIVDEANYVFSLNIGILQELEGSPLKAMWTLAISSLKQKLNFL
jgi:heme oxygenase